MSAGVQRHPGAPTGNEVAPDHAHCLCAASREDACKRFLAASGRGRGAERTGERKTHGQSDPRGQRRPSRGGPSPCRATGKGEEEEPAGPAGSRAGRRDRGLWDFCFLCQTPDQKEKIRNGRSAERKPTVEKYQDRSAESQDSCTHTHTARWPSWRCGDAEIRDVDGPVLCCGHET